MQISTETHISGRFVGGDKSEGISNRTRVERPAGAAGRRNMCSDLHGFCQVMRGLQAACHKRFSCRKDGTVLPIDRFVRP